MFKVYRQTQYGFKLIAETTYLEDALAVYANWNSAYIEQNGVRLKEKNPS